MHLDTVFSPSAAAPALSRRQLLLGAGMALAPLVCLPVQAGSAPYRVRRPLMGTLVDVVVEAGPTPQVQRQVQAALDEMQRLEAVMSRFDPHSQVSRINALAGRGTAVPVTRDLMRVLVQAQALAQRTGGRFDPALGAFTSQIDPGRGLLDAAQLRRLLPHARPQALVLDRQRQTARLVDAQARLDLGGVAKLPILQVGVARLQAMGLHGVMINGGGDVLATARSDGQPWRIGIRDAAHPDRLLAMVPLREGVVASSGDYERYIDLGRTRLHHIIDPATGRSTQGVHGVTLVGVRAEQVNGLGTAAMVAGPRAAARQLAQWGVRDFVVMHADGQVEASAGLRGGWLPPQGQRAIRGVL